jgi:hypothetical protein
MSKPRQSSHPISTEAEEVLARFEAVPASESESGRDEVYVVYDGRRIAMRGNPGTPQAGTWVALEPGFEVTVNGGELVVIHDTGPPWIH